MGDKVAQLSMGQIQDYRWVPSNPNCCLKSPGTRTRAVQVPDAMHVPCLLLPDAMSTAALADPWYPMLACMHGASTAHL